MGRSSSMATSLGCHHLQPPPHCLPYPGLPQDLANTPKEWKSLVISLPFAFLLWGFLLPSDFLEPQYIPGQWPWHGERMGQQGSVRTQAVPGVPHPRTPTLSLACPLGLCSPPSWLGSWARPSALPTCAFLQGWRTGLDHQGLPGSGVDSPHL